MVVADTNVLAYYLLRTEPFAGEARRFWRIFEAVAAPDSWRAELMNVLWMAVRTKYIDLAGAHRRFRRAENLIAETVPARLLRPAALRLAVQYDHPAYDTLFVAAAQRHRAPLATFDKGLLARFPAVAYRPGRIAAGAATE